MKQRPTDCYNCPNEHCLIKQHCLNANVDEHLDRKTTVMVKKTQNIFIEGAPIHSLYFVFAGTVKVMTTGIYGREQILRFAKDGEMLGIRGFSTHQYYQVGAVALTDTVMCSFPLEVLNKFFMEIPKLTYAVMHYYAEELHSSETKVRMFAHMTVREKVIDVLLYINRKFGQTNGFLNILLSRKEIADFAGTTEEQVIRILSALKKENLAKCVGKKIGIPDVEKLRREINEHHFFIQT